MILKKNELVILSLIALALIIIFLTAKFEQKGSGDKTEIIINGPETTLINESGKITNRKGE